MASKTVLLVEPDHHHHEILSGVLEHHGYAVVAVEADEIRDALSLWRPDLLVVAYPGRFPGGPAALDWIRTSPLTADLSILCISESAEPWEVEQARDSGCHVVCVKPVDAAEFAVQVRRLVGPSIE